MFTSRLTRFNSLYYHSRHQLSTTTSPLSTCIIGSGPSGCYTAKYLLKKVKDIQISILDELPTPFGLVRYGVAPDHSDTKNVVNDFTDNVLSDNRVSYFGNVKLNENISLQELQSMYDTVVLSYGASSDRNLGIEGEDLNGIYSSRQFVNWYNGHPYFVNTISDMDFIQNTSGNIVIIGQGNVAIDCARMLASNIDTLAKTDITHHALEKLKKFENCIKNIYIIGRRGAVQSSFTNKELREVINDMTDDCIASLNAEEMLKSVGNEASQKEINDSRAVKRKISIFDGAVYDDNDSVIINDKKCVHFRFLLSPIKFLSDDEGRVKSIIFEKNELIGDVNKQKPKGMNEFIEIEAGLVLTSIGYKSQCIDSENEILNNWDSSKHVLKNTNGKINDGLYCCGWLKRGPSGIIGTNIADAQQTVKSIVHDWEHNKFEDNNINSLQSEINLKTILQNKNINYVDKNGWFNIDQYEKDVGYQRGKIREKMINIDEMIKIANGFEL